MWNTLSNFTIYSFSSLPPFNEQLSSLSQTHREKRSAIEIHLFKRPPSIALPVTNKDIQKGTEYTQSNLNEASESMNPNGSYNSVSDAKVYMAVISDSDGVVVFIDGIIEWPGAQEMTTSISRIQGGYHVMIRSQSLAAERDFNLVCPTFACFQDARPISCSGDTATIRLMHPSRRIYQEEITGIGASEV